MNIRKVLILLLLCFPAVDGCSQGNGIQEYSDLSYLENPEVDSLQRLNLVVPDSGNNYPLLIWIGGGAWSYTDRNVEMDFARQMARQGIAVASVGHRLSPAVWRNPKRDSGIQHPGHANDIAAAFKWLYEHSGQYRYDKNNMFIGGFSSGAHLAALISLDPRYLSRMGYSPDLLRGVLPISGAFDMEAYYQGFIDRGDANMARDHVQAVFGKSREILSEASPTSYLENLKIPMLVICDNNVYVYTRLFEDRLRETDFREVSVSYAFDLSHAELWRNISNDPNSMYRNMMITFIGEHTVTKPN